MLMCLDVGNTHIVGGLFDDQQLKLRFRYATPQIGTADQFGLFLRGVLQTNNITVEQISAVALCSVVPGCNYTIRHAIMQYFPKAEYFILQAGVKTGINIKYKNPAEVGADLIAGAIGAADAFSGKNAVIVDLGTATTLVAVSKKNDFLGGVIMPGMRLAMESLRSNTAKLMEVDIEVPDTYLGQSTRECIQRGLYFGHLGAMREIVAGYREELFKGEEVIVIGTGGFATLFREEGIFDVILPDLVLQGVRIAYENSKAAAAKGAA
ncbi:MAG: type III pantothenate kinase [Alphaproteobacteria bacterium]|nr:type III pantothenate kinase [Alphaproteobacteria bacterium]